MSISARYITPLLTVVVCLVGNPALAVPAVEDVRLGEHTDRTRIVLDISEPVHFKIFTLADPYRVVVDLPEMEWLAPTSAYKIKGGLVAGLRFGLFKPGNSRLVLDATGPVTATKAFIVPPSADRGHRFVLDLAATTRQVFLAAMKAPAPRTRDATVNNGTPLPLSKPERKGGTPRVIVLDPGHGGVDPGTVALGGRFEKHVVLEYSQAIQQVLEAKKKYKIILTRGRDVFLSLKDRVRVAQEAKADLFISLHADSIANRNVRGGAVYTLSEMGSDAEADALAARENKSDLIAGVALGKHDDEVVSILIELAQRESMNYAAQFANVLVPELRQFGVPMRVKPHRFAAFRVLKAPDVPSILLELGYLTNEQDERYLLSPQARRSVARSIANAVDRYFRDLKG